MKGDLLIISARFPCPPYTGLAVRYAYFLKGLSQNWRLWVIAFADHKKQDRKELGIASMAPYCHFLEVLDTPREWSKWRRYLSLVTHRTPYSGVLPYYTQEFRSRLRRLLSIVHPDIALLLFLPIADYRHEVPQNTPIILDHPDAFSSAFFQAAWLSRGWHRRLFAFLDALKLREFQRRAAKECDWNIVVTERDQQLLHKLCPSAQIVVIPTGVDVNHFIPGNVKSRVEEVDILLTGTFTYSANISAAHYLCEEIMPLVWRRRPQTTVRLVGWQFSDQVRRFASERVQLVEKAPDIRPHLEAAKIFVAPYKFVFGIRYKILEAMAMGKAIVGTSDAFIGIPVQHGVHAFIADDPESLAEAIVILLDDPSLRDNLGKEARILMIEHFDWQIIIQQLNMLLEKTTKK